MDVVKNQEAYKKAVKWKTHKGVKYLHVKIGTTDGIQIIRIMKLMVTEMESHPPKSLRYFLDASESDVSLNTHMTLRRLSLPLQPLIYKSGFIGVTGYKVALFEAYRKFTKSKAKLFKTEKEALDYICS